jgi:hypothetical protein
MTILIDFDGTCVTHDFPNVGQDIGAVPVLKRLVDNGHQLILFTMRSDRLESNGHSDEFPEVSVGAFLQDAVDWFKKNDIPLYGIQTNPTQHTWTSSPKAYGQMIIDDTALGCPLERYSHKRPYVDWEEVEYMLIEQGLLPDIAYHQQYVI